MNKQAEKILDNLEMQFPFVVREGIEFNYQGDMEMLVTTKSGDRFVYDDFTKTLRSLPKSSINMSEEECRKEFGERLRKIMNRRGISQDKLSEITGITQASISKYINGTRTPTFFTADKLAKALDCSVDIFRYMD